MKLFNTLRNIITKYPLIMDGTIVRVLAVLAFVNLRSYWYLQPPMVHPFLAMTMILLTIIPLAWRRLFPVTVLLFITIIVIVLQVLDIPEMNFTGVASIVAIFSAAAYGGRRRNLACIVCIVAILGSLTYQMKKELRSLERRENANTNAEAQLLLDKNRYGSDISDEAYKRALERLQTERDHIAGRKEDVTREMRKLNESSVSMMGLKRLTSRQS